MVSEQLASKPDMKKVRSLINPGVLDMLRKGRFCGRLSVRWDGGEITSFRFGTEVSYRARRDEEDDLFFDV